MKRLRVKPVVLVLFMVMLFFRPPGAAAEAPPGLDVFLLTSQMQAQVLQGIIQIYGEALLGLGGAKQAFRSRMASFDTLSEKLRTGLGPDRPGNENMAKYFSKLKERKRIVQKTGELVLERRGSGRKIERGDIDPLEKAAFQTVYAARQLMRNIVRKMELDKTTPEEKRRIAEVLLLAEMQGHLLNSIKDAFADNLNCNTAPADTFWLDLASFDILITAYQAGRGILTEDPAGEAKTQALKELLTLKHEVLLEGEAMYLVAKTCRPDLEAARSVVQAAAKTGALFETLIGEALK